MSFDALKALDVTQYANKDCVLFLWAVDPMLPQALELMASWGFQFKTVAFNWIKTKKHSEGKTISENPFFTGMGYWTRANAELCLLGTRGKPKRLAKDVRRLLPAERREHSRKPDEIYERIERLVPGPYLELFARRERPGWTSIGDQLHLPASEVFDRNQPSSLVEREPCGRAVESHKS